MRLRAKQATDMVRKETLLPRAPRNENYSSHSGHDNKIQSPFLLINCIVLLLFIWPSLFSQDERLSQAENKLNQWFQQQKESNNYLELYDEFMAEIQLLIKQDITTDYFYEKLNQGLSKSVSPERLLLAIKEDVQSLIQAKKVIERLGVPEAQKINQANIKSLSIFLKAGLSMDFFDSLLQNYPSFEKTSERKAEEYTPRINQFLLLCESMVKINRAGQIENEQLVSLALALIKSPMEPKVYETLTSIYTRAKLKHLSDTMIISTMIEILQNNGGIIEITDQLNRRMRYR